MRGNRGQGGFTLVELLVAITIMSLIMGGIAESIIVGLHSTAAISTSVSESHDVQMMTAWFPRDVHGARNVWGDAAPGGTTPTCAALPNTVRTALTMTGGDPALPLLVSYVVVKRGSDYQLIRAVCQGAGVPQAAVVVVHGLSMAAAATPAICDAATPCPRLPSPPTHPVLVSLSVTELSGFAFQVTGQSVLNATAP